MGSRAPGSDRNSGQEAGNGPADGREGLERYLSRVWVKADEIKAKVINVAEKLSVGNPEAVVAVVAICMVALVVIALAFFISWRSQDHPTAVKNLPSPISADPRRSPALDPRQVAQGPLVVPEPIPKGARVASGVDREEGQAASGTEKFADDPDGLSLEILGVSLIGDRLDVRGEVHHSKYPSDLEVRVSLLEDIAEGAATALIDADTSTWRVSFHSRAHLRAGEKMEVEAVLLGESGSIELHRTRSRIVVQQSGGRP